SKPNKRYRNRHESEHGIENPELHIQKYIERSTNVPARQRRAHNQETQYLQPLIAQGCEQTHAHPLYERPRLSLEQNKQGPRGEQYRGLGNKQQIEQRIKGWGVSDSG